MIQSEEEYRLALEELKSIERQSKIFNEQKLIAAGYPIWIIRQQKSYIFSRPVELQQQISEYLKSHPKSGYRVSKYRRYRRARKPRNKPTKS